MSAWGVWQYALTGAGTTVAFGVSSLYLGGLLIPKRQKRVQDSPPDDKVLQAPISTTPGSASKTGPSAAVTTEAADVQWEQLSAAFGLENWGRSLKRNDDGSLTLTQTIVGSGLLCTGLFLMNMRTVSVWRGRKVKGNLDAEAFLRGFDKFMNEQTGAGSRGAGGADARAGAGKEQRQKTREEFDNFWRDFERKEREQDRRRQRAHEEFYEHFYRQREEFRREYGERFGREYGEEFGGGSSSRGPFGASVDPWQTPQVRDALRQLGLGGIDRSLTEKELKAAYRKAAKESHPDRVPEAEKAAAGERFKKISAAYATLRMRVVPEASGP